MTVQMVPLGSRIEFLTSGSRGWQKYYSDSGALFLRIQNVGKNRLLLDDVAYVRAPDGAESVRTQVKPGDVLLSITADLGRSAVVPENIRGAHINQHLALIRAPSIQSGYLAWYLCSEFGLRQIAKRDRGGVKSGLNFDDIHSLEVPLPAFEEQQRIAAILDRADAIRRKRQEAIALTEQLLRSTFLEMFGDPVANPRGWPTKPLGDLVTFTGGGTPSRSLPEYFTGKICWATSKDMKGEVLSDTEEHITADAIQNSATKLVPPGTILVVVKSKILMHRLPVLLATVPTCFGQDLKGLTLRDSGLTHYIARHMRIGQEALLRRARGVNTEGLTLEHLAEYAVLMPPRGMIDRYVNFEVAATQGLRIRREAQTEAEALFNSLVQRAFTGQL